MNASKILNDTIDHCEEYLEMIEDPSAFIAEVLAHKVVKLQNYVEYLEKRLENATTRN